MNTCPVLDPKSPPPAFKRMLPVLTSELPPIIRISPELPIKVAPVLVLMEPDFETESADVN